MVPVLWNRFLSLVNLNLSYFPFLNPQIAWNPTVNTEDILRAYLVINAYLLGSLSNEGVLKVVKRLSKRMAGDEIKYDFFLIVLV